MLNLLKMRHQAKCSIWSRLRQISFIATDVDGILTDGSLVYSKDGEELKIFHARDGMGIQLLKNAGIGIAIISGRDCPALRKRAQDLGISHLIFASKNKLVDILSLTRELNIDLAKIAYIGDDLVDCELLERCGIGVTVPDAPKVVKRKATLILRTPGGKGALREFIDMLLKVRN